MLKLYKHVNNTTVAAEFVKIFYIKEKEVYSVRVNWYKIGSKYPPMAMNISERVKIKKKDMLDWKIYEF